MQTRVNKFLSETGYCSRRKADELILAGKVCINGVKAVMGQKIDPEQDSVTIDGKEINHKQGLVYYALYKPVCVISTAQDEGGRETVLDLVPKEPRVYPVGRLDAMSEGLMILTNDGELTQQLTHPSFEHEKEYTVNAKAQMQDYKFTPAQIKQQFEEGMVIDGILMKADLADVALLRDACYELRVILHTGYNRQIRKMCAKIGLDIQALIRVRVGKLRLDDLHLKSGEYKEVSKNQIL